LMTEGQIAAVSSVRNARALSTLSSEPLHRRLRTPDVDTTPPPP
jgi:hypothetical protein